MEIISQSGVEATQFPSLDKDEDFVKLHLPLDGPTIQHFAEELGYPMPFTEASYQEVRSVANTKKTPWVRTYGSIWGRMNTHV